MSISSENNRNDYVGTGLLDEYDFTFLIFSASHLLVTTTDSDGNTDTLILNTDYTVDGTNNASGGTITLTSPLASGTQLSIRRVLPITQPTSISNQGDFYPETHEDTFDRGIMIDQQQQDELDRSIKIPETEDGNDFTLTLPSAEDRAGGVIAFDSNGNVVVTLPEVGTEDDTVYAVDAGPVIQSPDGLTYWRVIVDENGNIGTEPMGIGSVNDTIYALGAGPVIKTPDGTDAWRVVVDNDGNIGTEEVG